jgi:hypothetical protein
MQYTEPENDNMELFLKGLACACVSDPDPEPDWIRNQIGSGFNKVSGSGSEGKNDPQK